uniref:THAP-type domain-containing protein n=1 Tax=Esox lucius TaxID=8010 RepID=A0AAY5L8K0_ESOLU
MASNEPDNKRCKGGSYCIAPGSTNSFYRTGVHFHVLPLKRQPVLQKWLVAMKHQSPPIAPGSRVCSDHFIMEDYIYKPVYNASVMLTKLKTSCLKPVMP